VGRKPTAYFLKPRHGVRHIIATRDEARPHAGADGRDAHPYLARMVFAGGLGFAVGGLRRRTSGGADPYPGMARAARGAAPTWGGALDGRRGVGKPSSRKCVEILPVP